MDFCYKLIKVTKTFYILCKKVKFNLYFSNKKSPVLINPHKKNLCALFTGEFC